ncbi:MAG: hypothetical protein ACM3MK_10095 [Chitinophagales bacterium]
MTIRTVDMQVLIPKVSDVSKVQQIHQQENNARQQEFASHMNQKAVKIETTVNRSAEDAAVLIREKQEREKRQNNKEKKEGSSESKENNETSKPLAEPRGHLSGNSIDIII